MKLTFIYSIIWAIISIGIGVWLDSIGWSILAYILYLFAGMCVLHIIRTIGYLFR